MQPHDDNAASAMTARAVTLDDLHWIDERADPLTAPCPVCRHGGPHARLLTVPSLAPPHQTLTLSRCAVCASGFYDPPGITDFSDLNQDRDDFWRFYVEVGGGVWEMIWPLIVDRAGGTRTLLDVGCGFGFTVDFWRRAMHAEAIGVELADYGAVGARLLDIPIYREMLQVCEPLAGRRFDVVYASEVIEHVPDPRAFVALLAPFVADDGLLVLTTPAIDYIRRPNTSPTMLAALAPGFHGFLLSAQAFGDAARASGFEHVEVRRFGERQMLWASRVPRRLNFDTSTGVPAYFGYLEQRFARNEPSSPVWQGYTYRYVRDLIARGRFGEAHAKADVLVAALVSQYGSGIVDPNGMIERLRGAATLIDVGKMAPFFLPNLYYALGAIAEYHHRDPIGARRWYRGAADAARECARLGAIFFLEANHYIWPALAAEAGLALKHGDIDAAADTFARLARDGRHCRAADGFAVAEVEYIEAVMPRACEGFVLAGARDKARDVFEAYKAYLAESYGDRDFTSRDALERALAGGFADGPADPVFPFFFAGVLDANANEPSGERLRALLDLSAAHRTHEKYGELLARYADIGRRFVPAAKPKALFDFSYSVRAEKK